MIKLTYSNSRRIENFMNSDIVMLILSSDELVDDVNRFISSVV